MSYFPDAIPTAIGRAHPLTGEQLTSGALSVEQLGGQTPVAYYKPNSGKKSFLNPASGPRNLIFNVKKGREVEFSIHSKDNILSVQWDFGARFVASTGISNGGTGYSTATVTFAAAPAGGITATGVPVITGGVITGITMTNRGAGYLNAPAVTFAGNGTGAVGSSSLSPAVVVGGADARYVYPGAGTFDIAATVSYVGGTPANVVLTIPDLVVA